jgi:hypothetical protein
LARISFRDVRRPSSAIASMPLVNNNATIDVLTRELNFVNKDILSIEDYHDDPWTVHGQTFFN